MDKELILNKNKKNEQKKNTYRFDSTWFQHHIDPILCNGFSDRSEFTTDPILAATDTCMKTFSVAKIFGNAMAPGA
jgi:hypothetical protein